MESGFRYRPEDDRIILQGSRSFVLYICPVCNRVLPEHEWTESRGCFGRRWSHDDSTFHAKTEYERYEVEWITADSFHGLRMQSPPNGGEESRLKTSIIEP